MMLTGQVAHILTYCTFLDSIMNSLPHFSSHSFFLHYHAPPSLSSFSRSLPFSHNSNTAKFPPVRCTNLPRKTNLLPEILHRLHCTFPTSVQPRLLRSPTDRLAMHLQCALTHISLSSVFLLLLIGGSQPTSPFVTEPGPAASSTSHPSRCNALHRPEFAERALPSCRRVSVARRSECGIVSGVIRQGRWRI